MSCESSGARADFEKGVAGLNIGFAHDFFHDIGVDEQILRKPLFRRGPDFFEEWNQLGEIQRLLQREGVEILRDRFLQVPSVETVVLAELLKIDA